MVLGEFVEYGDRKSEKQKTWDEEVKRMPLAPGNGNKFNFSKLRYRGNLNRASVGIIEGFGERW
jgi:hypothetical protein